MTFTKVLGLGQQLPYYIFLLGYPFSENVIYGWSGPSGLIIPRPAAAARVLRIHYNRLLMVRVRARGERRLQDICELLDLQLAGHEGAPHFGALEAVERLHVVGPADAFLPHVVAARRLAPYHNVHLNTLLCLPYQNVGQCSAALQKTNKIILQNGSILDFPPAIFGLIISPEQLQVVPHRPASDTDEVLGANKAGVNVFPAIVGLKFRSLWSCQILEPEKQYVWNG